MNFDSSVLQFYPTLDYESRLPLRVHPNQDSVLHNVFHFLSTRWPWTSEESKKKYLSSHLIEAALYSFPEVKDDRMEIVAMFNCCSILLDDYLDDEEGGQSGESDLDQECDMTPERNACDEKKKAYIKRLLGVMMGKTKPNPSDAIESILTELCARILSYGEDSTTRAYGRRVLSSLVDWYHAAAGLGEERRAASMANLETYLDYRIVDVAAYHAYDMCFWASDIFLPPHIYHDPEVQRFFVLIAQHLSLLNDLYSYRKERGENPGYNGVLFNAVDIAAQTSPGKTVTYHDVQVGMKLVEQRLWRIEDEIFEVSGKIKDRYHHSKNGSERDVVERMIIALQEMAGGNVAWSKFCGRYNE